MDANTILFIIIAIVMMSYVVEQVLEYLNVKAQRKDIPDDVAAFYDRERYEKSLDYHRENTRFSFFTSAFSFALSMIMLLAGGFGWLDEMLRGVIDNEILIALAFFAVLALASDILSLPFQIYGTFVIEEKYGFNKTTASTFVADKLKGYLLGALIGGPLLALLIYLVTSIGPGFWIWFGAIAAVVILFVNIFYTSVILPLFNKLTPLPEGELRTAIEQFAEKVSFPLDQVFVMDGSRRSSKANAFFSGIGKKKKIVLYDTLIERHSTEELVAVLAHEVGHFKKRHIVWGVTLSVLQVFFVLFVMSLMIFNTQLSVALGASEWSVHVNLIAFTLLFSPVSVITGLLMSLLSRKNEFEADRYAAETYSGPALAEALKRLSVDNLSNLYPHPAYVFAYYSHPTLLQRLEKLQP